MSENNTKKNPIIRALESHLNVGDDWSALATDIPGIFVVKQPTTKSRPAKLCLAINPVDDMGNTTKRRPIYISNTEAFLGLVKMLEDDKENIVGLGKIIDSMNGVKPKNTKNANILSIRK